MKYIKRFEAVIIPTYIPTEHEINSFEDLVRYGDTQGFDVVKYDEFFNSLGVDDRKTAPPKGRIPFFALYHPERKKPMFVIDAINVFTPHLKNIVDDIISHEMLHGEQNLRRKGLTFKLPNPTERKKYFSNKDEIFLGQ